MPTISKPDLPSQLPRIISWNLTYRCHLHCPHCYLGAGNRGNRSELSTDQVKIILDQIAELTTPVIVLSGGEPLLREDIYEIARYGTGKGFRMVMGTSGVLISNEVAKALRRSGIRKIAVSLDSIYPELHDYFRGVPGTWTSAIRGIKASLKEGIDVQIHTTVLRENYHQMQSILDFGKQMGVRDFQFFFLVPTGRAKDLDDITPDLYETMIQNLLEIAEVEDLHLRPTCAPQFIRIANQRGLRKKEWQEGCLAGKTYCRITPEGNVTPCPYLPLSAGCLLEIPFKTIWRDAPLLTSLRDPENLKGKCGYCEYRIRCGGCRARAYGVQAGGERCGMTSPVYLEQSGYLAEDPWCTYQPVGNL